MNLNDNFRRLHFGEIKRLPNKIFDGASEKEIASLVVYVITVLNGYKTTESIRGISRNDLFNYGFGNLMRSDRVSGNLKLFNTYELLHLGFPYIKPWMVKCKPPGFFSNKDNIFELIRYEFGEVTNITRGELIRDLSSLVISYYWKSTIDLVYDYNLWLSDKKDKQKKLLATLEVYKRILSGELSRCPNNYWTNMSDEEVIFIIKYVKDNLMQEPNSGYDVLDMSKYHLTVFNKRFTFKSGRVTLNKNDLIEFVVEHTMLYRR